MTPAVDVVKAAGVDFELHEYRHAAGKVPYGTEAAEKLGVPGHLVFKTLVVMADTGEMLVGIVPVTASLSQKAIARAAAVRKTVMAELPRVERATGFVAGGVSPLGQRRVLRTFIDDSARTLPRMYVSAGRRGLEISLSPLDLAELTSAAFVPLAQ